MIEKIKNYAILFLTAVGSILFFVYQAALRKNKRLENEKQTSDLKGEQNVQHEKSKQLEARFKHNVNDFNKSMDEYRRNRRNQNQE
jgi:hypothetical protein